MSQRKKGEGEMTHQSGYKFVRNSKLRQSVRIANRINRQLPPSALIYMKNLEKTNCQEPVMTTTVTSTITEINRPTEKLSRHDSIGHLETEDFSDDSPLLRRMNSKRSSQNKITKNSKKRNKLTRLFNFFR